MAVGILIGLRVSESQVKLIDEYRAKHGGLSRSAAVRDLTAQQLRYQKWVDARRERNLPPYPTTRVPRLEVDPENASNFVRVTNALRDRNPNASEEDLARITVGSMTVLKGLKEKTKKLLRRVAREHDYTKLEEDLNRDLEARQIAASTSQPIGRSDR